MIAILIYFVLNAFLCGSSIEYMAEVSENKYSALDYISMLIIGILFALPIRICIQFYEKEQYPIKIIIKYHEVMKDTLKGFLVGGVYVIIVFIIMFFIKYKS